MPGRPGYAAEQHDLEAGPTPPVDGSAPASTNDKQMDVFFESVATIKARCALKVAPFGCNLPARMCQAYAAAPAWHSTSATSLSESLPGHLARGLYLSLYCSGVRQCALSKPLVLQGLLLDIRRKQGELQAAHERSKMVTRTDDMKRVRDQMQDDITEVGRIAHKAKGRLEALDKANEAAQRKAVCALC